MKSKREDIDRLQKVAEANNRELFGDNSVHILDGSGKDGEGKSRVFQIAVDVLPTEAE